MSFDTLRIALLGPAHAGGAALHLRRLGANLAAGGATVDTVAIATAGWPRLAWRLWRLAPRVEIFHVMAGAGWHWQRCAAIAVAIGRLRSVRVVLQYGDGDGSTDDMLARLGPFNAFWLRRADVLLVPSGYLARCFGRRGFRPRVHPNCVELSGFPPSEHARDGFPTLLCARKLDGADVAAALRAFALVRAVFPGATMLVAGSGPERRALDALTIELDILEAVHFTGRIEHAAMADLLRCADILINPGSAEQLPLSLLEALAAGVPVVSSDRGALAELLGQDGRGAVLAPGEPQALAHAAISLLRDSGRAGRLRAAGRARAASLDWPAVAPRLLAQYRRALARPARALHARLAGGVLFPLHEWLLGRASAGLRRDMEFSQWWSAEELRVAQRGRLRELVQHAASHVPYYWRLFARDGVDALQAGAPGYLRRLPLLTRAGLAELAGGRECPEPSRLRMAHDVAAKWRAARWWDAEVGERALLAVSAPVHAHAASPLRRLRDWLLRVTVLPASDQSALRLDRHVARIRRVRPAIVFGSPSSLSMIARHAEARRVSLADIGIRVAFAGTEPLGAEQRASIERIFGCPVAHAYASRIAGFIAHECPSGGMHVAADNVIVEVIDSDGNPVGPGVSGEIVVTRLAVHALPLIRFATGDNGALAAAPCPCGRTLPLIERLARRADTSAD